MSVAFTSDIDSEGSRQPDHEPHRQNSTQVWAHPVQYDCGGEIYIGDLVQMILLYVEALPKTLFAVSSVSRGWRERANWLPQWNMADAKYNTTWMQRRSNQFLSATLTAFHNRHAAVLLAKLKKDQAKDRDGFLAHRVSERSLAAKVEREKFTMCRNSLISGFLLFWYTLLLAALYGLAYGVGSRLGSDVTVGCAYAFTVLPINILALFLAIIYEEGRGNVYAVTVRFQSVTFKTRDINKALYAQLWTIGLTLGLIFALLQARVSYLQTLDNGPRLTLGCGPVMSMAPVAPVTVTFTDTSRWDYNSTVLTSLFVNSATQASRVLFLVSNCTNTTIAVLQPADRSNITSWPPAWAPNGTWTVRTPLPTRYFPVTSSVSDWYASSYWRTRAIPAITLNRDELPSAALSRYTAGRNNVLIAAGAYLAATYLPLLLCRTFASIAAIIVVIIAFLIHNPVVMLIIGAFCYSNPSNSACLMSRESGLALLIVGGLSIVAIVIVVIVILRR